MYRNLSEQMSCSFEIFSMISRASETYGFPSSFGENAVPHTAQVPMSSGQIQHFILQSSQLHFFPHSVLNSYK